MKRSEQNLIAGPVEGYKIVNADMTCRGMSFEVGKRVRVESNPEKPLELCSWGIHFCEYPSGPWAYYSEGRVFKVRAYGVLPQKKTPGADYKLVCKEVELYEEVFFTGDGNTGSWNTGSWNTGDGNTGSWNTGDRNTGSWNTGSWNTGSWNTGDGNTGSWNTGDGNTGDRNTGDRNTGDRNTGSWNTGSWNTGDGNTGDRNTGDRNTGSWNTGSWNTGNGNCGSRHSGSLNTGDAPLYLFNKIVKAPRADVHWDLVHRLSKLLAVDEVIDPTPFLSIPNATAAKIKKLHQAHIKARKGLKK